MRLIGLKMVDANHDGNRMRFAAGKLANLRLENDKAEPALRGDLLRLRTGARRAGEADDDAVGDSVVVEAGTEVGGPALRGDEGQGCGEIGRETARQPARVGIVIVDKGRNPDGEDDLIRPVCGVGRGVGAAFDQCLPAGLLVPGASEREAADLLREAGEGRSRR